MAAPSPRVGENPKLFSAKALAALRIANGRLIDCREFYHDVQKGFGGDGK